MKNKNNNQLVKAKNLLKNGYTKHKNMFTIDLSTCEYFFQKCIMNSNNEKMYFINVFEYDFSKMKTKNVYLGKHLIQYQAEVTFNKKSLVWTVQLSSAQDITIEDMEKFFMEQYTKMKCDINKLNN